MRIPLPRMMRHWREREFARRLSPAKFRYGLGFWAFFAAQPALYRLLAGIGARVLGRRRPWRRLPFAGGWTGTRDFPASEGRSFMALWRAGRRR